MELLPGSEVATWSSAVSSSWWHCVSPPPCEWPSLLSTSSLYAVASSVGSTCRNAAMFQMYSSLMFLPQAGMPLALVPCLITQNALAQSTLSLLRSGGVGYRTWLNSVSAIDGARWHPAHIAA